MNKVCYLLSEAREQPQTCRWVSSRLRLELIKDASNLISQKIPYAGFSYRRSHSGGYGNDIMIMTCVRHVAMQCWYLHRKYTCGGYMYDDNSFFAVNALTVVIIIAVVCFLFVVLVCCVCCCCCIWCARRRKRYNVW